MTVSCFYWMTMSFIENSFSCRYIFNMNSNLYLKTWHFTIRKNLIRAQIASVDNI